MFSKTVKACLVALALGVPATTGALAYPHTVYQAQIDIQINAVIQSIRNAGFNFLIGNARGQMYGAGSRLSYYVNLHQGVQYRFEGRCDSDCRDLDLVLRDLGGRELVADRDDDDIPGFTFTPSTTGTYVLTFELAHCRAYRCQVGAVVMARTA